VTFHGRRLNRKGKIWLTGFLLIIFSLTLLIVEVHHLLHPRPQTTTQVATNQDSGFSKYMDKKVQKLEKTNSDLENENFDYTIYDVAKEKTYHWSQGTVDQMYTASTVKVPILVGLLYQNSKLTDSEKELVAGMIRQSNNTDATALFKKIGGVDGLNETFSRLGMTHSQASSKWWLSTVSSEDYIKLLKNIFVKSSKISRSDRNYIISEMFQVNKKQQWGIKGFSDSANFLANKNGWTLSGSWIMNSIGAVEVKGHLYLISIMSDNHPDGSGNAGLKKAEKEMSKIVGYSGDYIL
jgi:hypothetical protein